MAQDLGKRYPLDTQVQGLGLSAVRGQLALDKKDPAAALASLQVGLPVELGSLSYEIYGSCLYPTYLRGEAYLAAGQGKEAAGEFQKIIDHNGIVWNCWTGALARLGVARANALQAGVGFGSHPSPKAGERVEQPNPADADAARVRALAAYKAFLTLWKDADPEIPIYKAAKTEYAKLH